jgi:hypothetical protein
MKVSTENDNNFGYEKITILVDNIPLTKINCITLKIHSKADNSVFQYSNANDMRVTQDLNSFGEIIAHAQCSVDEKIYIYIFRVYHIRIIATKKLVHTT